MRKVLTRVLLTLAGVLAAAVVVAFLVALFGPLAEHATPHDRDRAAAVNSTRQILLATTAGIAALIGLGFTARTFYLSRRGQLTDRYSKAITQLASDKLTERLGGIYALEHLMRESSRDHETVVEVLAAFVRESAPFHEGKDDPERRPRTDVQAALTVLARRPQRREIDAIDLSNTDLRGANLSRARLAQADLMRAQLQRANLVRAQLQRANLLLAQLQGASLAEAQLQGAGLAEAQLQGARLAGAQLQGAYLLLAQLQGASLAGAQLQQANLGDAQLQGASLAGAQLQGANLAGAQLQRANLGSAQLQQANLGDAQLQGASLAGAYLCDANGLNAAYGLTAEQVTSAATTEQATLPLYLQIVSRQAPPARTASE